MTICLNVPVRGRWDNVETVSDLTGLREGDSYDRVLGGVSYRPAGRYLLGAFVRAVHCNKATMNIVDMYCSL